MLLRRDEHGAAVVDFVLAMLVLVPLVLGILQVALVLHVRNTATAAASAGARDAAREGASCDDGVRRARSGLAGSVPGSVSTAVTCSAGSVEGRDGTLVRVRASVPALGLFGPRVSLDVTGHAVREVEP